MDSPTQKQIDFAQAIGEELGIDPPFDGDREEYSEFISDNIDEFYKERDKRRYATGECFKLNHQASLQEFEYEEINKNPDTI